MRCHLIFAIAVSYWIIGLAVGAEPTINQEQRLLEHQGGGTIHVGTALPQFSFNDLGGTVHDVGRGKANAFVFLSTGCPLAKRYTQRLNRLHQEFSEDEITLVGVFSNYEDDRAGVEAHAKAMKFAFPSVYDVNGYLARRLGAEMTPQVVVSDGEGVIRYRGAIDDNRYENRVKERYLYNALNALREGKRVEPALTKCLGCTIHLEEPAELGEVTYTQHIARILQDNCQTCHRPNQVAPFPLTNYREAKAWATEINAYAKARLMPPWKAAPGFGEFQHERRLTSEELVLIDRWVKEGTPEGPLADLPPSPKFVDGWTLGEPDAVLEMPEEFQVAAEGEDDYRHFVIPTNFDRDMYVEAADVIPGSRQSVHHVIVYVDTTGKARELDAADPGPGYSRFGDVGFRPASSLGGWAPGSVPAKTPTGTGRWLPKGADVVLQVHYYHTGVEASDRTKVGLYFSESDKPVRMKVGVAINKDFKIPKDEKRHPVEAQWEIKEPIYAVNVAPHMHLLGHDMKVTATLPDGTVTPLIWIKQWDFNWQGSYYFRKPLLLPTGTKVNVLAHFDNSKSNPNQPNDPPTLVEWGERTTDEMCIAFVGYVKADEWQPLPVQTIANVNAQSPR